MEDFLSALNTKSKLMIRSSKPEPVFYGTPDRMPAEDREEMVFKYMYLHATVNSLASEYRITPNALQLFIDAEELTQKAFDTEDSFIEFESEVNAKYKQLRVRLAGLLALHTAKVWRHLAASEENLLEALKTATEDLKSAAVVDVRSIATLASAHAKLADRHVLFTNAMDISHNKDMKGLVDALTKKLNDVLDDIEGSVYKLPSMEIDGQDEASQPPVAD